MKVGQVGRSGTFGLQGSEFTTMNLQSRDFSGSIVTIFWTPSNALKPKIGKIDKNIFTFYKGKSRPEKSRDPGIWQNPVPENPGIENLDPARACSP